MHFFFLLTTLFCFLQNTAYNYIPLSLVALTVIISFATNNIRIKTKNELFVWIVFLQFSLLIFPLISLFISFLFNINNIFEYNYDQLNPVGRVLSLLFIVSFIFALYHNFSRGENFYKPIKFFWYGLWLLALTGIWQLLSFNNLLTFPFETRTNIHSVSTSELEYITGRLTGICKEPSYFVVLICDFVILSLLFLYHKRKSLMLFVATSAICLYFAFSPTGYIVTLSSLVGPFLSMIFYKKMGKYLIRFIPIFFLVVAFFIYSDGGFYFIKRLEILDQSSRYQMVLLPFDLIFNADLFTALFGYGIKSYSIVGPSMNLAITSNNIFSDVLCESGVLGLFSLLITLIYIYYNILKSKFSKFQKYIALALFFDLLSSSIFRADYASLRFYIMIYSIYVLTYVDLRVVTNNEKSGVENGRISFN